MATSLVDYVDHPAPRVFCAYLRLLAPSGAVGRRLRAVGVGAPLADHVGHPVHSCSAHISAFLLPAMPYDGTFKQLSWAHLLLTTLAIPSTACSAHISAFLPGMPIVRVLWSQMSTESGATQLRDPWSRVGYPSFGYNHGALAVVVGAVFSVARHWISLLWICLGERDQSERQVRDSFSLTP